MKKTLIILGICSVLLAMPAMTAMSTTDIVKKVTEQKTLATPDYDGTWVGGFGQVSKEGEEWQFEYAGYIAGAYKNRNRVTILGGSILDLDQEPTGNTIVLIKFKSIVIGKIKNEEGNGLPVIGFLITTDEDLFIGRLMSLIGPAPHIWGQFTPN